MNQSDPVRERLLHVGRELFCKRGFDGTSIREVTSQANANLGAVTYHFGSKEEFYHAVISSMGEEFAQALVKASQSHGTALDRIEAVVRAALSQIVSKPSAPTLILRELANDGPMPAPLINLFKRNAGVVASLIAEGQKAGSIRDGNPALLAISVISQPFFFNVAGNVLTQGLGVSRNGADWERDGDHVVRSVRRSIAAEPQTQ